MTSEFPTRVFSGIKPSGALTLGNYLGAIKRFVEMQDTQQNNLYCVVDLHAITVRQDPQTLTDATREICAGFIAAGLDPKKSILFNQSAVGEHAQLAWIFNCVARVGWLNRMTQFKDKAGKKRENASVGLFAYPNLMAADILLYHATHVPVGEDQKQHIELARDIATKFNNDFGVDFFPLPEPIIEGPATRVMSLRDGRVKMSKSDPSNMSRINMLDDADSIAHKISKARTDSDPLPENAKDLQGRAEAQNLVNIYAALSGQSVDDVLDEFGGKGFSAFKPVLTDLAVSVLAPISKRMYDLCKDKTELDDILAQGAERARAIAHPILKKTYDIIGIIDSHQNKRHKSHI